MSGALATLLLLVATVAGGFAAVVRRPRSMTIAWLACGLSTALFLLAIGFETLAVIDALFTAASATVLHLHATLQGTLAVADAERSSRRVDWIHAGGAFVTLVAILCFALLGTHSAPETASELAPAPFSATLLGSFPELSSVLGAALFLVVVVAASIGRPTWTARKGEDA
jgi:hypothetical protein